MKFHKILIDRSAFYSKEYDKLLDLGVLWNSLRGIKNTN